MTRPTKSSLANGDPIATAGHLSAALPTRDVVATLVMFAYWILYENVIFFYAQDFGGTSLLIVTNLLKLGLPILIVAYAGLPSPRLLTRGPVSRYLIFFGAFLLWLLVPTLLGGDLGLWLKLLPHLLLFVGAVSLFSRVPAAMVLFAKCYVLYVLAALVQYGVMYATAGWESRFATPNGFLMGPYGLLGNAMGVVFFPGVNLPFVRLTGFWNEPSNASGSAFAAYFLSVFLVRVGAGRRWRLAALGCFVAGLAAMSNAGYLALAGGFLAGAVITKGKGTFRALMRVALLLPIIGALVSVSVFGRTYVADNLVDNPWARAITGLRDVEGQRDDPMGGRTDILQESVRSVSSTLVGSGLQEVRSSQTRVSASAPVYWLLMAGVPGILLLLMREAVLLFTGFRVAGKWPLAAPVFQALVVVMVQHTSYGTWMNPNYLLLAAAVLVLSIEYEKVARNLRSGVSVLNLA